MKTRHVCKGSGKLPVTQLPNAESAGEEMACNCPICNGRGILEGQWR